MQSFGSKQVLVTPKVFRR